MQQLNLISTFCKVDKPNISFKMSTKKNLHVQLAHFNHVRLLPQFIHDKWALDIQNEFELLLMEGQYVELMRLDIQPYLAHMPLSAEAFVEWFEQLKINAPGQDDFLFPWLAYEATLEQMCWFLQQEAAGEAGFDDLVALSQIKLPPQPKLELARNYWDEMGRGHLHGMHGLMLDKVVNDLNLKPCIEDTAWESLALANLMLALAINRRYAYQSIGALGAVEMTAPTRVAYVNEGLKRLGVDFDTRKYFQLHATIDIKHSKAWNSEVIYNLVKSNPLIAKPIAEGALMRLCCGASCYNRYKSHFNLND